MIVFFRVLCVQFSNKDVNDVNRRRTNAYVVNFELIQHNIQYINSF